MTNQEILEKALCKVKGYPYGIILYPSILEDKRYYSIIFDIEFAKNFWGSEIICTLCHLPEGSKGQCGEWVDSFPAWEVYLREMIIEKEPLKYLEKFL